MIERRRSGLAAWWLRHRGSAAWLALVLIAAAGFFWIQHIANQSNHALCALRTDLQNRIDQTQQFLDHPHSFPQFNDPKTLALIKSQVDGQQRTVEALSDLSCS